jgi:predicted TIM-barrel fold metal-dependent hydrolase
MQLTRRHFLKTTIATSAACGLAQTAIPNTQPSAEQITDTHVYLGHWPHEQLPIEDPTKLIEELQRNNVSQAWVGSFEGLFHKDIAAVNERLIESCKASNRANTRRPTVADPPQPALIPFGTINPTLPDWEEDVRRCHEVFHMPGIRLHPDYHGYTLDDPRFTRVLDLAAAGGLIVQLVACLENRQTYLLSPPTTQVDLKPFVDTVTPNKKLRVLIANGYKTPGNDALRSLGKAEHVCFDLGRTTDAADVLEILGAVSADRIVFGSGAPLRRIDNAWSKLRKLKLSAAENQAIARLNASKLLASERKEGRQ